MENREPPPPAIPKLGMIVDRTSFDQTDDFGVDHDALESSLWSKPEEGELNATHAVVMKNGKVRRRLRWRPKAMMKRPQIPVSSYYGERKRISSSASVASSGNDSQSSKTSKKSVHSFASTATPIKSNKQKSQIKWNPFPLLQTNYPDTFHGVTTIKNEGEQVLARMGSMQLSSTSAVPLDATVFIRTDSNQSKPKSNSIESNEAVPRNLAARSTSLGSFRRKGIPPLSASHTRSDSMIGMRTIGNRGKFKLPQCQDTLPTIRSGEGSAPSDSSTEQINSTTGSMKGDASNATTPTHSTENNTSVSSSDPNLDSASKALNNFPIPAVIVSARTTSSPYFPGKGIPALSASLSESHSMEGRRTTGIKGRFKFLRGQDTTPTIRSEESTPSAPLNGIATTHSTEIHTSVANCPKLDSISDGDDVCRNIENFTILSLSGKEVEAELALPSLPGEELEPERRVDLRILPSAERRDGPESIGERMLDQRRTKSRLFLPIMFSKSSIPLSIDELRDQTVEIPPVSFVNKSDEKVSSVLNSTLLHTVIKDVESGTFPAVEEDLPCASDSKTVREENIDEDSEVDAPEQHLELRFSMAEARDSTAVDAVSGKPPSQQKGDDGRTPPSPTQHKSNSASKCQTAPLGVNNGSFLMAEKNLQAIHQMAAEHLLHGEYREALEVFEEILRGQLVRYGPDHFRVGTALHNIGIVHMKKGDYSNAVKVCKEAVRVRKKTLASDHPDVAVSLAQLGVAYLESKKYRKAIGVFREALRIRRRCLGPKHSKVATILNNIGCALYELNELEIAKVAFEEALEVQRETLRKLPLDSKQLSHQGLLSIASTLSNIGSIKLYWGLFDEASINLEEVLLIQQCVLGDEHPVSRRSQESLQWVERTRNFDSDAKAVETTLSQTAKSISSPSNCSVPQQDQSIQTTELVTTTPSLNAGVLHSLEQKFTTFQNSIEHACSANKASPETSNET